MNAKQITEAMQATIAHQLEGRYTNGIRKIAMALGIETRNAKRAQMIVWVSQELALSSRAQLRAGYRLS
jgi:hypothetical protein